MRFTGRDKIRKDVFLTALYVSLVFAAACIGRYLVSLAFGADAAMIIQFVTTDFLSYVFALVAVFAVRNSEGIFEDQKDYLFRLDRERREKEQGE